MYDHISCIWKAFNAFTTQKSFYSRITFHCQLIHCMTNLLIHFPCEGNETNFFVELKERQMNDFLFKLKRRTAVWSSNCTQSGSHFVWIWKQSPRAGWRIKKCCQFWTVNLSLLFQAMNQWANYDAIVGTEGSGHPWVRQEHDVLWDISLYNSYPAINYIGDYEGIKPFKKIRSQVPKLITTNHGLCQSDCDPFSGCLHLIRWALPAVLQTQMDAKLSHWRSDRIRR